MINTAKKKIIIAFPGQLKIAVLCTCRLIIKAINNPMATRKVNLRRALTLLRKSTSSMPRAATSQLNAKPDTGILPPLKVSSNTYLSAVKEKLKGPILKGANGSAKAASRVKTCQGISPSAPRICKAGTSRANTSNRANKTQTR